MRPPNPKVAVIRFDALLAGLCFCALLQVCQGQQQLAPAVMQPVQFIPGPVRVNVEGIAEINVPEGFQFTGQQAAKAALEAANSPVPDGLVGLLAPSTPGKWYALLQFVSVGYVPNPDQHQLDEAAILQAVQGDISRQLKAPASSGVAPNLKVEWAVPPTYDSAQKKLEWAFKVESQSPGSRATVNYTTSLLGRRGVLGVLVVPSSPDDLDLVSIRRVVKGISFLEHERYADYAPGDKIANFDLAGLITTRQMRPSLRRFMWPGVAVGSLLASVVVLVLGIRAVKRLRTQHARAAGLQSIVPLAPAGSAPAAQNGHHPQAVPAPIQPLPANGHVPALAASGAHRNGKKQRQSDRKRRKYFRYQNFYSDMVMSLTRCNYVGAFGSFEAENEEESNGSVLPYRKPAAAPVTPMPDTAKTLMSETSKLIESQQKLIEGQRRLIEEQSKLIEEKSKLIDVENRVLEKQSELFAEQQLL